ncbi:FadR/GntR family transcriptional regulator [Microbacterium sp. NIBRBAC000506063]|uniref:FadR/GntR family transcriptional regulator n=1 Tax=Microbacterium sp. NIBRBAC000506063 TaxID=2734618 RepID=UPI001CB757DC|nr:FCD domain-containing protein [Microbacterium sp. NIBRBAC000506063]
MLVAQRIVADIQRNGNNAGDRLPHEKVMLEQYQVGRGTLRESLRFLELQGLISLKPGPGGGPVVEQPDGTGLETALVLLLQFENAPFRTIVEARAGLEPMMARLAATRLTDDELVEIKRNLDRMGEHLDDESVFLEVNQEFHDLIAHGSKNVLFTHLIDAVAGILEGSVVGITYTQPRRQATHAAHVRVYNALAARDPQGAADAMREHISEFTHHAERKFPDALDAPISWGNGSS